MYIPKSFEVANLDKLHEHIERHSFATLVSQDGAELCASHLPLLLERNSGPHGTLIGHMARANPQWRHSDGQNVLAIFPGPHCYISPNWYQDINVVPTWNYAVVHACGTLRKEENPQRLREIVGRYVKFYEGGSPGAWSMDQAEPEFIDKLLAGIVGFEIVIERIEGKWKLNQNHDEERRKKVIQGLREQEGENEQQVANLIAQTLAKPGSVEL